MADEERFARPSAADAIALGAEGKLDPRAAAYLEEQTRLARLQANDLLREGKLRHWSLIVHHIGDVLKLTFEMTVASVALVIVVAIGSAFWSATHDNGLVIEAF